MGAQRREGFKRAYESEAKVIIWIEPEKEGIIEFIEHIANPILNGESDIVIPNRKSLNSYPKFQQYSEMFGNLFWHKLVGIELDMWFGPRVWHRNISKYFIDYHGEYGDQWDAIFVPVMRAIKDGKKVSSQDVNFIYPREQAEMEEDISFYKKRLTQLNNLIPALETEWKKLLSNSHEV